LQKNLELLRVKRNEAIAKNNSLRSDINKVRKEKKVYEEINKNLEKEVEEMKSKLKEETQTYKLEYVRKHDQTKRS